MDRRAGRSVDRWLERQIGKSIDMAGHIGRLIDGWAGRQGDGYVGGQVGV